MKKYWLSLFIFSSTASLSAQENLPILHTQNKEVSIRDGELLRENHWTIDPEIENDVYFADKSRHSKAISFYSDSDSISFDLKPSGQIDFIILLNGKDTCYTQIKSSFHPVTYDPKDLTKDTIPFTLTSSNNISIQAILNEVDTLQLMFHTGQNSIALTEKATEKISSLKLGDAQSASSWGGADNTTRYSKGNSLQIKNFNWDQLIIWQDKHSGPGTDGKFGPNLFKGKLIEFNFDGGFLVIHASLPELGEGFEKMDLEFIRNSMFLQTCYEVNGAQYHNKVMIHSGYSGTLLLDDEFVRENKIGEQLKTISESELRDSYGNVLKTKKAILPLLSIGKTNFTDIPIGFFEGAIGRQKMSVLGGNVLKRFNILLDLQNAWIYLKPNELFDLPFEEN